MKKYHFDGNLNADEGKNMKSLHYRLITGQDDWMRHAEHLPAFFALHRQLRPAMESLDEYKAQIGRILEDRGQLLLAYNVEETLVALALYRMHHNTYQHKLFFLEDLVVDENCRDSGIGGIVLRKLEEIAREQDCHYLSLDSGTFRTRAHKFYYMNDYVADCFHFAKKL